MGSPNITALFAQRVVIGVGDMAVSNNFNTVLSTYALGSCIGVAAYDPISKVGGILHLMLPESTISPEKAATQPAMFADTGLPHFFRALAGMKAERPRLRIYVAGGASVIGGMDTFKIGERNQRATLDFLATNGFIVGQSQVGGTVNRTLHLDVSTGALTLKTPTDSGQFSLAA